MITQIASEDRAICCWGIKPCSALCHICWLMIDDDCIKYCNINDKVLNVTVGSLWY